MFFKIEKNFESVFRHRHNKSKERSNLLVEEVARSVGRQDLPSSPRSRQTYPRHLPQPRAPAPAGLALGWQSRECALCRQPCRSSGGERRGSVRYAQGEPEGAAWLRHRRGCKCPPTEALPRHREAGEDEAHLAWQGTCERRDGTLSSVLSLWSLSATQNFLFGGETVESQLLVGVVWPTAWLLGPPFNMRRSDRS